MKRKFFLPKTIFRKNPSVRTIETENGIIISPVDNKKECIYYLERGISSKIWKLIDGKKSLHQINKAFNFSGKIKTWNKDFNKFIYDLFSEKLITIRKVK